MFDQLNTVASDVAGHLPTIPGTRMKVDWPKLVSGQDIILTTPPQDTLNGLRLGNGDIGVSVFGLPECMTLTVGKNDILDYRDRAAFDDNWTVPTPSAKPAGAIRFRNRSLAGGTYSARLHLWDAEVTASAWPPNRPGGTNPVSMRAFVSYPRNLIVVEFNASGDQHFDIELARNRDSTGLIPNAPEFGASGRDIWVRCKFPPDPLNYPEGFEYAMYGRVIGGEEVHSEINNEFATVKQWVWQGLLKDVEGTCVKEAVEGVSVAHVRSSGPVTLLVAVSTMRENPDPLARAKEEVDEAERAGLAELKREHRDHWHRYWRRSFVQLPEKAFLTQQWFVSQYLLACCSRAGRAFPGQFGPWIWEDFPGWGNDIHWDYQAQSTVWGAYSSNHLEQTVAYNEQALALLPMAEQGAQEFFGIDGALYPVLSWPRRYERYVLPMQHVAINGWVAYPMWWYYLYSQDEEYLRTVGYAVIRAITSFFEGFVKRAPDGKYDVPPTEMWDHAGVGIKGGNGTMELAFARYLMRACVAASEVLDVDADKRPIWKDMADNLREYPTTVVAKGFTPEDWDSVGRKDPVYTMADFSGGEVFVTYEGMPFIEFGGLMTITPVFPGDDIGLHSPQPMRDIAWRTFALTPYYLWDDLIMLSMGWVRLGYDILDFFEEHTKVLRLANGCMIIPGWKTNAFTNLFGWPIVVNESILQSYTGRLRFAPVRLKYGVRFAQLRTVGAFLVSGEISPGGAIAYLTITSEAGKPCALIRPWEGVVRIRELSTMEPLRITESHGVLSFETKKGATYIVDRPDAPWEKQPITTIQAPKAEPEPIPVPWTRSSRYRRSRDMQSE